MVTTISGNLRRSILLLALGVSSAGCILGDPPEVFEDAPCECPNTERIVADIDWFGDGRAAGSMQSIGSGLEGSETPLVGLDFEEFASKHDANAALAALTAHFMASGLPPLETTRPDTARLIIDGARVTIHSPFVDRDLLLIQVMVELFGEDSEAPELLAPIVEALGTLN